MPLKRESRRRLVGLFVAVWVAVTLILQFTIPDLGWAADFVGKLTLALFLFLPAASIAIGRFMKDPRKVFVPFGMMAVLFPMVLIAVAAQLRSAELIFVGIGLIFVGLFFVLRFAWVDWAEPLTITPDIFLRAMRGTSPSSDEPKRLSLPFKNIPAARLRQFGRHMRKSRIAAYAWTWRGRTTIAFGRIDARRFRIMYPWALLFGATKVVLKPGSCEISVDRRTYRFLDKPGPYDAYCRGLLSVIEEEYGRLRWPSRLSQEGKQSPATESSGTAR